MTKDQIIARLLQTLEHIKDLADENTKLVDGYSQISEWCYNDLRDIRASKEVGNDGAKILQLSGTPRHTYL